MTWDAWVIDQGKNHPNYKTFLISQSESRMYIEAVSNKGSIGGKYIVDVNGATLDSALGVESNGKYHLGVFNYLSGDKSKPNPDPKLKPILIPIPIVPGIYTPPVKETNQWVLPVSLMSTALSAVIAASVIYLKGNTSFKIKDILKEIDNTLVGKKTINQLIKEIK